ncbi:PhzF family phenazine biosynthesis protein, partial [Actinoplanes sp. NPDC051633]|uniref:PhzF family phenazine biosynthesis protein n=1 Tax=Actinoplanes sp. NPDC051633 TaxID=3155670 RepID=UPI00343B53E0
MTVAVPVSVVVSCLDGRSGGSPTAVVRDDPALSDEQRRAVPAEVGVSHAGFVRGREVRFFTGTGELLNCGHGLIAVQAAQLFRTGRPWLRSRLRAGGRPVHTVAVRTGPVSADVWFDQGRIALSPAGVDGELAAALGVTAADVGAEACIASPGTPRILLPVRDRAALHALEPDMEALAAWCRARGLLGCLAYAPPSRAADHDTHQATGVVAARMFAPAIGVPEDLLNANSSGCLAAWLHRRDG